MEILLLCDDAAPDHATTTLEHIASFGRFSRHSVRTLNPVGVRAMRLLRLEQFDVVVVHHSVVLTEEHHLSRALRAKLAAYDGVKVCFRQDEFRWVNRTNDVLRELGVDVLFTVAPLDAAAQIYAPNLDRMEIVQTLTGYVPEAAVARPSPPLAERRVDVGYRGRTLPYWLGRLAQEKIEIGREFLMRAQATDLVCDIAWGEHDRIYGDDWVRFLESCRCTLATESGASIADFDGSIEESVRRFMAAHPDATFDDVHAAVLEPYEGNVVVTAISPRIFEAAAARSALILFPGHYSGILRPHEHYVPLERDFSNFHDVVATIRDLRALEELVERAHVDLIRSGRFAHSELVAQFDAVVDRACADRRRRPSRQAGAAYARAARETELRRAVRTQRALARGRMVRVRGVLRRLPATLLMTLGDHAVRRLLRGYVLHPRLLRRAPPRLMLRDLAKLAAVRRARTMTDDLAAAYDPSVRGVSITQGRPHVTPPPATPLEQLVWEFDSGERSVSYRLPGGRSAEIPFRIGHEPDYRFRALEAYSHVLPRPIWDALAPFFAAEPDTRSV